MTSVALDFRELHRELCAEFFYYADQRGRSYLDSLLLQYWSARGPVLVGASANLTGTKFLITLDDPESLGDQVKKALMLADHVIIRHDRLLPVQGLILDAIPDDFAGFSPLEWIEKHRDELPDSTSLPYFRSPPPREEIGGFIEWLCTEGRPWFESGAVTYAPVLLPGEVEMALLTEGVNLSHFFRQARVLPQEGRLADPAAAVALANLEIPYLASVTPDRLQKLREDEYEVFAAFRSHLLGLLSGITAEASTPSFSKEIERHSQALSDETARLERAIEKSMRAQSWRRVRGEILALSAGVFFWLGLEAPAVAGLTAAAVDLAKTAKEGFEERFSLRENPVYFLARLGELSQRRKWKQLVTRRS